MKWIMISVFLAVGCSDSTPNQNNLNNVTMPDSGCTGDPAACEGMADQDFNNNTDMGGDQLGAVELDSGWNDLPSLSQGPRQETAVVALDGKIWVLGGFDAGIQVVATVEFYDPQNRTWQSATDLPVAMHHANAAVINGKIYVVGFLTGAFVPDGRAFVYDPDTDTWQPAGSMPMGRERGSAVVGTVGGKIYIAGGSRNGAVKDFSVYDPSDQSFATLPDAPRAVDHAGFGVIGDTIVIAGGRDTDINAHLARVDIYDVTTGTWTLGAQMPTSRGGVAAAVVDDKLYILGGEGAPNVDGVFENVEVYDSAADSWLELNPMPNPRHGMGAAGLNGAIYVPGGAGKQAFAPSALVEAFVP